VLHQNFDPFHSVSARSDDIIFSIADHYCVAGGKVLLIQDVADRFGNFLRIAGVEHSGKAFRKRGGNTPGE